VSAIDEQFASVPLDVVLQADHVYERFLQRQSIELQALMFHGKKYVLLRLEHAEAIRDNTFKEFSP